MEDEGLEQKVQGKYSDTEEAILSYLYENPGVSTGTSHLVDILRPAKNPPSIDKDSVEARQKEFDEIQYGIETLIAARLAAGQRVLHYGHLQYVQLKLTPKGEAEAINQKRRIKKVILHPAPKQRQARPPLVPDFGQDGTTK